MNPNDVLASGYEMARQLVEVMCSDLTEEEFYHQAIPQTNCAAWIVGHLAMTARQTAQRLGAAELPAVTEDFVARFGVTRKPAETQSALGTKQELIALLAACVERLVAAIRPLSPDLLAGPPIIPLPFARTCSESVLFGALHFAMHAGQISTIRRSIGKPPMA